MSSLFHPGLAVPVRRALARLRTTLVAGLTLGLACTAVQAQTPVAGTPRELRLANGAPAGSIWANQAERWVQAVERESQGQLKLRLFLGAQLGADTAVIQQVASGRIDMASVSLTSASVLAPEVLVASLPMQYRSRAEFDCVVDTGVGALVGERLARKGLHMIALSNAGSIQLAGRKGYRTPSDLSGVRAGTTGAKLTMLMWAALGASPVVVSTPEVAAAFQTGLIDVAATTPVYHVSSGINKLAPVISMLDLYQMPSLVVINKKTWDSLSEAQRTTLLRTRTPASSLRQEVADSEERALAEHVRTGGQVVTSSADRRALTRAQLASRYTEMVAEAGPEGIELHRRVEEVRKACEKLR